MTVLESKNVQPCRMFVEGQVRVRSGDVNSIKVRANVIPKFARVSTLQPPPSKDWPNEHLSAFIQLGLPIPI